MSCGSDDDEGCPSRAERVGGFRVKPPKGYRLATPSELFSLPDGAMSCFPKMGVWTRCPSSDLGGPASPGRDYAVPEKDADDLKAEQDFRTALSKPAPAAAPTLPAGYQLATEANMDCLPKGSVLWRADKWVSCSEGVCVVPYLRCISVYAVPITPQPVVASADPKAADTQVGGSHYKGLAIQPAEYCQRNRLPYCEANVVKYVTRHREKNGREDIEKAIHYLQLLLEIDYPKP